MLFQSINVSYPKSHGNGPKRLSDLVSRPMGPKNRAGYMSFRQVIRNTKNNTSYAKR